MNSSWSLISSNLPIFEAFHTGYALFYTPGALAVVPGEFTTEFKLGLGKDESPIPACDSLRQFAIQAQTAWDDLHSAPFAPVCLTVYLSDSCKLNCAYCYAQPSSRARARLSLSSIREAATIVAKNCQSAGLPMTLVFHGGGEPTDNMTNLSRALKTVEEVAQAYHLEMMRYIATNGVLEPQDASWLAHNFDRVGISCDGPEDIQGLQRPIRGGANSLPFVEHTAEILHKHSTPFDVRVTVTPATYNRQEEIAAFVCQKLAPQSIHVEPVYFGGRSLRKNCFNPEDELEFANCFMQARDLASQYRVRWSTSLSRPGDIHGPYCNTRRAVLTLLPDGSITDCFKANSASIAMDRTIGKIGPNSGEMYIDAAKVEHINRMAGELSQECQICFNRYHCTRGCPDACPARTIDSIDSSFRCRLSKRLSDRLIREQANRAIQNKTLDSTFITKIEEA